MIFLLCKVRDSGWRERSQWTHLIQVSLRNARTAASRRSFLHHQCPQLADCSLWRVRDRSRTHCGHPRTSGYG